MLYLARSDSQTLPVRYIFISQTTDKMNSSISFYDVGKQFSQSLIGLESSSFDQLIKHYVIRVTSLSSSNDGCG